MLSFETGRVFFNTFNNIILLLERPVLKFLSTLRQRLSALHFSFWTIPLGLLVLMAAAYALFIPQLGFYWDDWTQLLVERLYPLSTYWQYFASDRPTSAWTHILFVPLLGLKPLNWQFFTLGLRWLTVLGMWWSLALLWPNNKRTLTAAAFLFAVYPAFRQQPTAVAYHQHWLQFALYFASLGCMILAVQRKKFRTGWILLALLLEALQFSITEFYAGIELIRPVILWVALSEEKNKRKRLETSLLSWMPYLLLLLGFTGWRLFFSGIEKSTPQLLYLFRENPIAALMQLLQFASVDELYITISSWAKTLKIDINLPNQPTVYLSWFISLAVTLASWAYFQWLPDETAEKPSVKRQMLFIGILVTLVGPSPIWLAGGRVLAENDFHADRFAMASMWGISLVTVVAVEYFTRNWRRGALMISILIGLATGLQVRITDEYRAIWKDQQRFYWQLLWRAPQLQNGTTIISENTFLEHQELFSTSSAINHLYPQAAQPQTLAYWIYRLVPAYETVALDKDISFHTRHRIYSFNGSLNTGIVIQYNPQVSDCLWVLSEEDALNPDLSPLMQQAAMHTDLSSIGPQAEMVSGYPPLEMIGSELPHDWCYIYEKAELAAQQADWAEVLLLADQAQAADYVPAEGASSHAREWLPMIKAYLYEGEADMAGQISQKLITNNAKMRPMICSTWELTSQVDEQDPVIQTDWMNKLACAID
jgi:hypothetical protein